MERKNILAILAVIAIFLAIGLLFVGLGQKTGNAVLENTGNKEIEKTNESKSPTSTPQEKIEETKKEKEVVLYFFYGEGCPHCAKQKPFLEKMKEKYPTLVVKSYEVWHNQENKELFLKFAKAFGVNASGVPMTYIGEFNPIIGYGSDETTGKTIEERISYCVEYGCIDTMAKVSR